MKKRTFKRIASGIAALTLAATLAIPMTAVMTANAAGTITFQTSDGAGTGAGVGDSHLYEVYRIFKGTGVGTGTTNGNGFGNEGNAQLNGITWANPEGAVAFVTALKSCQVTNTTNDGKISPFASLTPATATAAEVATIIETLNNAQAKEFADYVIKNCAANIEKVTTEATKSPISIADETPGYYLIKETSTDVDAVTNYLLGVYDGKTAITINVKTSKPSVVKKVQENVKTGPDSWDSSANKPFEGEDRWNDVADYTKGDMVPFRIQATLPSTLDEFNDYWIKFTDHLDPGFKLPETIKINIGSTDYTFTKGGTATAPTYACTTPADPGFDGKKTITVTATGDDTTDGWDIVIEVVDVKSFGAAASGKVTVDYSAMLDADALVSTAGGTKKGNYNDVMLTYDNNPTTDGHGGSDEEQDTPKDGVVVYTYDLEIHKYDGVDKTTRENKWLAGADFVLAQAALSGDADNGFTGKFFAYNNNTKEYGWVEGKITGTSPSRGIEITDAVKTSTAGWAIITKTTEAGQVSSFEGLDDGTYYLVELNAPSGYNCATEAIAVTVKGTTDNKQNADAIGAGNSTSGRNAEELTNVRFTYTGETGDQTVVWVENNSGAMLPGTGGIGTTLFYVIGGTLVVGAGVTLITKKRMQKNG